MEWCDRSVEASYVLFGTVELLDADVEHEVGHSIELDMSVFTHDGDVELDPIDWIAKHHHPLEYLIPCTTGEFLDRLDIFHETNYIGEGTHWLIDVLLEGATAVFDQRYLSIIDGFVDDSLVSHC